MQNDWWTTLAERTQRYADMGDMLAFYEAVKAVYGPSHEIQAPLRSSDGSTPLTDKEIQELLEKKRSCRNRLLAKPDAQAAKAAYKTACSALQAKLRTMQNNW